MKTPSANFPLPGIRCQNVACWVDSIAQPDEVVRVARALTAAAAGRYGVILCLDAGCRSRTAVELGLRGPLTPEMIGTVQRKLDELYGWRIPTMVLPGHPLREIRRYALTKGLDLIIMGEQGLALEGAYEGRLCDDAPCAVMVLVRPRGTPTEQR